MSKAIQSVRGMNDILPGESELWELFEDTIRSWLKSYGYSPIRLPIVEPTPLFKRAIGEVTDIVEKEMYSFEDSLNGENLTLRPEGTAGCVRAVIQHNLAAQRPQRLYYMGQMFRHERPQKGRYRQFNQVGVESFGFAGPDIDAEQIVMGARLWDDLGLDGIKLQLNSLGQSEERAKYRDGLITYFEKYQDMLDEDAKRRLYTNPLRILGSKNPWEKPAAWLRAWPEIRLALQMKSATNSSAGVSKRSRGVPCCAMRWRFMTMIWSETAIASSWSCVT